MKQETRGRKPLSILDSTPHSNIIFLIASGIDYPEAISKARNTDSSSTVKQLENLKEARFLNKPVKEKLLNKTIYSVNWEKIIEEFMKEVNEQKEQIIKQSEFLKANMQEVFGSKMDLLKYLDNKEFLEKIKKNFYLQSYLKFYFGKIAQVSRNYTISQTLGYLLFFADFDFLYSVQMNIQRIGYFLEQQNRGEIPKTIAGIPEEKWHKLDMKQQDKLMKSHLRKGMKEQSEELETSFDVAIKRTKEIIDKDKELTELLILNNIFKILKFELTLQTSLNETTLAVGKLILKKHLTEEEYNRLEQFDFGRMRPKTKEEYNKEQTKVQNPHINKENITK